MYWACPYPLPHDFQQSPYPAFFVCVNTGNVNRATGNDKQWLNIKCREHLRCKFGDSPRSINMTDGLKNADDIDGG